MLDIEALNKKTEELYEQDTILINQVDNLFKLMNEVVNKMAAFKSTIDEQQRKIDVLTEDSGLKLYRIMWKTGHTQTLFARDTNDARVRLMRDFTGSDIIINIILLE